MKSLNPLSDYLSTIRKIQDSVRINIPQIDIPKMELINSMVELHKQIIPHIDFGINLKKQITSFPFPQIELSKELTKKIDIIKSVNIPNAFSLYGYEYSSIEKIQKYFTSTIDLCAQIGLYSYDEKQLETELDSIIKILPKKDPNQITKEDINAINIALQNSDIRAFWYFIIPIIITLIITYNTNTSVPQVASNTNFTQIDIATPKKEELVSEFSKTLKILCLEQRKAKISTYARNKASSNSSIISTIEKEQIVFVQQMQHKWVYIVYQDSDYMIKSGWTLKKHLEYLD